MESRWTVYVSHASKQIRWTPADGVMSFVTQPFGPFFINAYHVQVSAEVSVELMGDLPVARVNRTTRAFIYTGVDYPARVRSQCEQLSVEDINRTKPISRIIRMPHNQGFTFRARERLFFCHFYCHVLQCFVSRRRPPPTSPCIPITEPPFTAPIGNCPMRTRWQSEIRIFNRHRNQLATSGTAWYFLPAASPHFAGLWKAGVKRQKCQASFQTMHRSPDANF